MACSEPPVYWSTGHQRASSVGSTGALSFLGDRYRYQYQLESMNVSIVSVSRCAGPPHFGQVVFMKAASDLSGLLPLPA